MKCLQTPVQVLDYTMFEMADRSGKLETTYPITCATSCIEDDNKLDIQVMMLCILYCVRVIVMSTELSTKPKNTAFCAGINTDLFILMVNPSSVRSCIVSSTDVQHFS